MLDLERTISRRALVLGAASSAVLLVAGATRPQNIAEAAEGFRSDKEVRPGRYYPFGDGLRGPLEKFAAAHQQATGEVVADRLLDNGILGIFESAECHANSACGICNGFASYQAAEPKLPIRNVAYAGQVFTPDDLDALGTVFHGGDAPTVEVFGNRQFVYDADNPDGQTGEPVFFHWMVEKYLRGARVPLALDRSTVAGQVWSNPFDQLTRESYQLANGLWRVNATIRAANYLEKSEEGPFKLWGISYEIDPNDVFNPGRYLSDFHPVRVWRPDYDPNRPLNPEMSGYAIRQTFFTPGMISSYRRLMLAAA